MSFSTSNTPTGFRTPFDLVNQAGLTAMWPESITELGAALDGLAIQDVDRIDLDKRERLITSCKKIYWILSSLGALEFQDRSRKYQWDLLDPRPTFNEESIGVYKGPELAETIIKEFKEDARDQWRSDTEELLNDLEHIFSSLTQPEQAMNSSSFSWYLKRINDPVWGHLDEMLKGRDKMREGTLSDEGRRKLKTAATFVKHFLRARQTELCDIIFPGVGLDSLSSSSPAGETTGTEAIRRTLTSFRSDFTQISYSFDDPFHGGHVDGLLGDLERAVRSLKACHLQWHNGSQTAGANS